MAAPIPPFAPVYSNDAYMDLVEDVTRLVREPADEFTDCTYCGSSGDPDTTGNCRGCGASRKREPSIATSRIPNPSDPHRY